MPSPACLAGRGARDHAFDHRLPRRGILQEAGTVRWGLDHGKLAMNQWFFGIPTRCTISKTYGKNGKHQKSSKVRSRIWETEENNYFAKGLLPIQYQYQPLGAPVPIELLRYLELTGLVQNV